MQAGLTFRPSGAGSEGPPQSLAKLELVGDPGDHIEAIQLRNIAWTMDHVSELGEVLAEPFALRNDALHIVGGGHSVKETIATADGALCPVNGAHDWLIERGIIPEFCGLLDWSSVVAEQITPHEGVTYVVASQCHPDLFEKLRGHKILIWHTPLAAKYIPAGSIMFGGGPTMTQRATPVFYLLGFREFHLHGVDACFGDGDGSHVYDWREEGISGVTPVDVYCLGRWFKTRFDWAYQAQWFNRLLDIYKEWEKAGTMDPITIKVHGDGLIPHMARMRGVHALNVA